MRAGAPATAPVGMAGLRIMTAMEKAKQVGELVLRQQKQKATLAQLQSKAERIGQAYSAFGMAQSRWAVNASGELTIQQPNERERAAVDALLSKEELIAFLRELQAAERAMAETTQQLRPLGVQL
jgi:hypothetical protein